MKRILVISPTFPLPLDMGSKIRIYNLIKWLSIEAEIDLAALSVDPLDKNREKEMTNLCGEIVVTEIKNRRQIPFIQAFLTREPYRVHKFRSKDFAQSVVRLLERKEYDIIWCICLNMLYYLEDRFAQKSYVILDMLNEDELVWLKYQENVSFFLKKLFARKNISNIRRFRAKKQNLCDLVLSVSDRDKNSTQMWLPDGVALDVVPNGVDTDFFGKTMDHTGQSLAKNILFCGSMDIAMNQEAVKKFISMVFPNVKKEVKEAKFWIVGRNPPRSILKFSDEDIIVTGSVDDVRPYYAKAVVAVAPFEFGGGTKLKILEALAAEVPVVSTSVGTQGLDVVDGEHLLIRDDWTSFQESLVKLLNDFNLRKKLTINGRRFVEAHHSWDAIITSFRKRHPDVFS